MQAVKDVSPLYEVERRPHLVTNGGAISATFLVLQGVGEYDFVPLLDKNTG